MTENYNLIEVFHEIKSPLATIKINVDILKDSIFNPVNVKNLEIIENEIERIDKVIKKYTSFNNEKKLEKDYIYFEDVIAGIIEDNNITFPDINITVNANKEVSILAYEYHIYMIFSNIIKNSIEAMNGIGNIFINIKEIDGVAIIEVIDEGSGIKEDELFKLKKGRYTSKINGSGLGTTIIKNIVNIYNGSFYLTNMKNGGVKAVVQLPIQL